MEETPSSTAWEPHGPHLTKPDSIHMLMESQFCLRPSSTPPAHTVGPLVRCGVGSGSPARPSSLCILVLGASSPRQRVRATSLPPRCSITGPAILPEQDLAIGPSAPCSSQQGQHLYTHTRWEQAQSEKKRQFRSEDRAGMGSPAGCCGGQGCLGLSQACQTEGAFCPSLPEQRTLEWQVSAVRELRLPHVGETLMLVENRSGDRKGPDLGFLDVPMVQK